MQFYRYEIMQFGSSDSLLSHTQLVLQTFNMFSETPKGYWIGSGSVTDLHSKGCWVSKTAKKRYAYPTKLEAINNYIKRTERRKKILKAQIDACKEGLRLANAELIKEKL